MHRVLEIAPLRRLAELDIVWCLHFNRASRRRELERLFALVSRLACRFHRAGGGRLRGHAGCCRLITRGTTQQVVDPAAIGRIFLTRGRSRCLSHRGRASLRRGGGLAFRRDGAAQGRLGFDARHGGRGRFPQMLGDRGLHRR